MWPVAVRVGRQEGRRVGSWLGSEGVVNPMGDRRSSHQPGAGWGSPRWVSGRRPQLGNGSQPQCWRVRYKVRVLRKQGDANEGLMLSVADSEDAGTSSGIGSLAASSSLWSG